MKKSIIKSAKAFWNTIPLILSTVLLISLISVIIPQTVYTNIFSKNFFLDSLIGSLVGSISAGNPITSYLFGGEMIKQGVSLIAVTTFLVTWVTVGILQLPAEIATLGKKFALLRNSTAFGLAILVGIITVVIVGLF